MNELGPEPQLVQQWDRVRVRLRAEVGEAAFRSWLHPLRLDGVRDGQVKMALPTRFMRDWVMTHYADRLRSLWSGENPGIKTIEIVVAAPPRGLAPRDAAPAAAGVPATGIDYLAPPHAR